ncbi:MAG TPA: rhodanese-like domain-containing protein [Gaiellaceae bacterium]|nr:rhodanese-like domain-containing protein [Gaiellaceae bacterium]
MVFRQFVDSDLGCASYLVGSEGVAAVVDPALAIEQYLEEAERQGVRIVACLETHTHADHVSGHGRLALEHDVRVHAHPAGAPEYPFEPLEDGAVLELGTVAVTVLHTPGHRPEHCAFAVADRSRSEEPWLVLTGDSLFVGDVARPDLAVEPEEGARDLYRSMQRLLDLGDGVEVYPGHVAGSLCGAAMSSKGSSTIGFERRFSSILALASEDEFVDASTSSAGAKPPNVAHVVALNRGPFVAQPPPLEPVGASDADVVLDVRSAEAFATGHVRGALNVPLDARSFGTKAGYVLAPEERIALHADTPEQAQRAAHRLHAVGLLQVAGYLVDPPATERMHPVDLDELERLLRDGAADVIDVRDPHERDAGYIPGTRHVPYRLLRALAGDGNGHGAVVTICETGARAAIAASVLAAAGVDARPVLHGGVAAWRERGHATIGFRRCGA